MIIMPRGEEILAIAVSGRDKLRRSLKESMLPQAQKLTEVFRVLPGIEKSKSAD